MDQTNQTKRRQIVAVIVLDVPHSLREQDVGDEIIVMRSLSRHPGPNTRVVGVEVLAVQDENGDTVYESSPAR